MSQHKGIVFISIYFETTIMWNSYLSFYVANIRQDWMCGITQKDRSIRIAHKINSFYSSTFNHGQVAGNTPS